MAITSDNVPAEEDPWALPDFQIKTTPWSERSLGGKVKYVLWDCILKPVLLIGLIYMFICSLDFLSSAFRLLGGRAAGEAFANSVILSNPVAGLMIGVLATVLVQSSSTSTSIVITMVGSEVLTIKSAVYIIMGANIGTTVTNTIVAMGQAAYKDEFRRAFGAATVHDMFNWLTVIVVLPLEAIFGGLYRFTEWLVDQMNLESSEMEDLEILKVITKPFTDLIVKIDKDVIKDLSLGLEVSEDRTVLKRWCSKPENVSYFDNTINITTYNTTGSYERCDNLFAQSDLADAVAGAILLVLALTILCLCLFFIVKLLHSMLHGNIAKLIKKVINMDIPKVPWLTGYVAILFGAGATIVVQSSSIFTSTLTPLVGVGLIKLDRMYPLTLGSNIGTTATGVLAALVAEGDALKREMQVAMVHLFFNIAGILMWYPLPFMRRVPIKAAKCLGNTTADYRWFAVLYLICMFFVFPAIVFGLSLAGWYVLVAVGAPILLIAVAVAIINLLQSKKPNWLPAKLRTWDFLPLWMHSWEPLDRVFTAACRCCKCCQAKEDPMAIDTEKAIGSIDSEKAVEYIDPEKAVESIDPEKGMETNGVASGEDNPCFTQL